MSEEKTVRLVFNGVLQPGRNLQEVKAGLPDALKLSAQQVEGLFLGGSVVIKRGLPESRLAAYLDYLAKAGLCVDVEEEASASVSAAAELKEPAATPAEFEQMVCPQCGAKQPKRTLCRECGVDMPRYAAAQAVLRDEPQPVPPQAKKVAAPTYPQSEEETLPGIFGLSFSGRLNRMRYCIYGLALYALLIVAVLLLVGSMMAGSMMSNMFSDTFAFLAIIPLGLLFLASMFYGFRYSVQRLHDMGYSGWLVLLSFVPFIGWLIWLVLLVWPGSKGSNEYGPPNPPNSTVHQVIAVGLTVLLVVLVAVGFGKMMTMSVGEMRYGPWHMQTPSEQEETPRLERM